MATLFTWMTSQCVRRAVRRISLGPLGEYKAACQVPHGIQVRGMLHRLGLVMQLHEAIGFQQLRKREHGFATVARSRWSKHPCIEVMR